MKTLPDFRSSFDVLLNSLIAFLACQAFGNSALMSGEFGWFSYSFQAHEALEASMLGDMRAHATVTHRIGV